MKLVANMKNDLGDLSTINFYPRKIFNFIFIAIDGPYSKGPPSDDAFIIPIPSDCVGLVIGKGGETIKMLQDKSGCRRVMVALDP